MMERACRSIIRFSQPDSRSMVVRCGELPVDFRHRDEGRLVERHSELANIRPQGRILAALLREAFNYATKENVVSEGLQSQVPVPGYPALIIRQIDSGVGTCDDIPGRQGHVVGIET